MQILEKKSNFSIEKAKIIFLSFMKELLRNKFTVFIMTALPVIIFSVIYYATTTILMTFKVNSSTITVSMKDVHTVTGSLTAISLLAGIAGFYLAIGSRSIDRRLISSGYSSQLIVFVKLFITVFFVIIGSIFLIILELIFRPPNNLVPFSLALIFTGIMYGLIGILVASLIPREFEGSLIILTLSFLDTMFITNPMSPGTYNTAFSKLFPAYAPVQLVLNASFISDNSKIPTLYIISFIYIFILMLFVGYFYWRSTKLYNKSSINQSIKEVLL